MSECKHKSCVAAGYPELRDYELELTLFETYLTTVSGTYVCKQTKYETIESKVIKHWEDE